jgi:hypothetical protein
LSSVLLLLGFVGVLVLVLLIWLLRDPRRLANSDDDLASKEELGRRHVTYFPQVRQAIDAEDFAFLASRGLPKLTDRVRKERRRVALAYLACLRGEFQKLWRLARVIASMSPQVGAAQEFARLRLGLAFSLRYEIIRIKFFFGLAPLPELGSLSEVVSRLSIRLETAMKNLGESAALASKLTSSLHNRRSLDTP